MRGNRSELRRTLATLLTVAALSAGGAAQVTWNVPGDLPTIQGAIAAASDGDSIEIEPGTYPEALESLGKSLTIVGLGGAAATIVDATGQGTSVLRLVSPTGFGNVHVQGLTLTGGVGTSGPAPGEFPRGGGVFIDGGLHELRECVIRGNSAHGGGGAWGGYPGTLLLQDCEVAFNTATDGGGASGGTLLRCHVHHNTATSRGGGLAFVEAAQDCLIEANEAQFGGGAYSSAPSLSGCVFRGNHASIHGGGLMDQDTESLAGLRFEGNTAANFGGGAFVVAGSAFDGLTVDRCVFAGNSAAVADGLYMQAPTLLLAPFETSRCTLVGDQLYNGSPGATLGVRSSILRGLSEPIHSTLQQVSYSNVEGGVPGPGNIDADPLFVDEAGGDFALHPGSPCINTGDPSLPPDADGSVADMGAIPFHPWLDLGGGIAGTAGLPELSGAGPLMGGQPMSVSLAGAPPLQPTTLVAGLNALGVPFKGGTLWPAPDMLIDGVTAGGAGSWTLGATWPAGIPSGFSFVMQVWFPDAGAAQGFAASNGLRATTP